MTRPKFSFVRNFAVCAVTFTLAIATFATAQNETVLHSFRSGGGADGRAPDGGVVVDTKGALYGTTSGGGKYGFGTVYKLAPPVSQGGAWKQNILYNFTGAADGGSPTGGLLLNVRNGKIYGTAQSGGAHSSGAVYELTPPVAPGNPWAETVIYSFTGGPDGGAPASGVVSDAKGTLYGSTATGGSHQSGAVFRLSPPARGGTWTERVLYSFNSIDGALPYPSGLIFGADGTLYGTTGSGTAFQLSPPSGGGPWTESDLYTFNGENGNGAIPSSSLVADGTGDLYGTTVQGGQYSNGTVYELIPPGTSGGAWTEVVLYSFSLSGSGDGAYPLASPVFDSTGALYGTTEFGGDDGYGAVFKLSPPTTQGGAWAEEVLHSFSGGSDGSYSYSPLLVVGTTLYGTTSQGGAGNCSTFGALGCGTVFEITQ